ncbi:hypothetical protein GCM10010302_78510 [Streptomyces polychromogenes]|uniref:Uncharacterized protein n=1 Tax=Streptomyces polychromogenes TaxID=67342 RepID=A0ABP3FXN1_9ACTN
MVGVAVAWITGTFEERPPQPPKLTEERYVRPFSEEDHLRKPYQITQTFETGECPIHSLYSTDPQALRCGAESIHDPCWQGFKLVVCLRSPWDPDVAAIKNATVPDVGAEPTAEDVPSWALPFRDVWALEIRDPSNPKSTLQCARVGGLTEVIAGMAVHWRCNTPGRHDPEDLPAGSLIGEITRSQTKPWTVFYTSEDSSEVLRAEIVTVWH